LPIIKGVFIFYLLLGPNGLYCWFYGKLYVSLCDNKRFRSSCSLLASHSRRHGL